MEGIPGIQNFDYSRFYGSGMDLSSLAASGIDLSSLSEEEVAKLLQEQKMKWVKSSAMSPQGQQQPGAAAGAADGTGAADGAANADAAGAQGAAGQAAGAGEAIINKNGTKMNAQEVATISDIFKKAGKSGMKADELAAKLKERGIEATATKVNGKMALKFANGDTFVDTSANGVLDTDDKEWTEALKTLKSKYGDNPPLLQGGQGGNNAVTPVNNTDNGQAVNNNANANANVQAVNAAGNTPQAANTALNTQLPNPTGETKGQDASQLKTVLSDLDSSLSAKGYKGSTAQELLESGELENVLSKYGIQVPTELEQNGAGNYVNNLFRNALLISSLS
jgi:hypothetical protein